MLHIRHTGLPVPVREPSKHAASTSGARKRDRGRGGRSSSGLQQGAGRDTRQANKENRDPSMRASAQQQDAGSDSDLDFDHGPSD